MTSGSVFLSYITFAMIDSNLFKTPWIKSTDTEEQTILFQKVLTLCSEVTIAIAILDFSPCQKSFGKVFIPLKSLKTLWQLIYCSLCNCCCWYIWLKKLFSCLNILNYVLFDSVFPQHSGVHLVQCDAWRISRVLLRVRKWQTVGANPEASFSTMWHFGHMVQTYTCVF